MAIERSREDFLDKFSISDEEFADSNISWDNLNEIYDDYIAYQHDFEKVADFIAKILRSHKNVHSVRSRVKNPEHLIAKLIRKTKQRQKLYENEDFQFTVDNYKSEITDLVGVRAIHIFKEEWKEIHKYIKKKWETIEEEAKTRAGDDKKIYEDVGLEVKDYDSGYRSVHYIIKTKPTNFEVYTEIQVRTIFEEGYGEIDHRLSYPRKNTTKILNDNLLLLNRLAGSADEMSSYIIKLRDSLDESEKELIETILENEKLKDEIEELKDKVEKSAMNKDDKSSFVSTLDSLKKRYDMSKIYNKNLDNKLINESLKIDISKLLDKNNGYYLPKHGLKTNDIYDFFSKVNIDSRDKNKSDKDD